MYKIEKNIVIPDKHHRKGKHQFPFNEMKVGDSFVASVVQNILSAAGSAFCKTHQSNWKFTTQKVTTTSTRIWRIK
jgi:hypothetical protein